MNPKLLKWLIIILVLIIIVGWGIFYAYQKFSNPSPTSIPSPLAVVTSRSKAEQIAYEQCLDPTSKPEAAAMEQLLSPLGSRVYWTYDDDFTKKVCLFGFKGNEIIGELYFITASTSGEMGVATIKWQSAP